MRYFVLVILWLIASAANAQPATLRNELPIQQVKGIKTVVKLVVVLDTATTHFHSDTSELFIIKIKTQKNKTTWVSSLG